MSRYKGNFMCKITIFFNEEIMHYPFNKRIQRHGCIIANTLEKKSFPVTRGRSVWRCSCIIPHPLLGLKAITSSTV